MTKSAFAIILVASLGNGPPASRGEPPPAAPKAGPPANKTKLQQLMQRKRELAHEVFDAIVAKDFERIRPDAKVLVSLSQVAEWRVYQTPRYLQYSAEFQQAAERLAEKARDKNADGTTQAFTQMIFSCVRCHDYIREMRSTRIGPSPGTPPAGGSRAEAVRPGASG